MVTEFKFLEVKEDDSFDPSVIYHGASFTQAGFYGDWQTKLGRTVKRFVVKQGEEILAYCQLIKYPLIAGKSYLYAPYGPVVRDQSDDFLVALKRELKKVAKAEKAVFVRLDFAPVVPNDILLKFFTKSPLCTYRSSYFQPRVEWVLPLNKTENELLADMHKNTRYSIRQAVERGIEVEVVTTNFAKYFNQFYNLMAETATRDGFSLHPPDYYQAIFASLEQAGKSFLTISKFEGKVLAIDLIVVFGDTAHYVFSGSSGEERARFPAYAALWQAMVQAKSLGCRHFNFGGIAADGFGKGWEGITAFKKKFGGAECRHSDFYDLIISPFWYYLYVLRKWLKS